MEKYQYDSESENSSDDESMLDFSKLCPYSFEPKVKISDIESDSTDSSGGEETHDEAGHSMRRVRQHAHAPAHAS